MSTPHPYDNQERPPALRLGVGISNPISGSPIPFLGKVDTGAGITKVPEDLKARLEPLRQIGETWIRYGDDRREKYPTYLAVIHLNGLSFDAEVYFRRADYILIGRDVLNQLQFCADGKFFTFFENAPPPSPPPTSPAPLQSPP